MAKFTKEQLKKWNEQARGGFRFDWQFYLTWGEKRLEKRIDAGGGAFYAVILEYNNELQPIHEGARYMTETGRKIPVYRVEYNNPIGTDGESAGAWKLYNVTTAKDAEQIGEPESAAKYATLCRISGEIDAAGIVEKIAAKKAEQAARFDTMAALLKN